ncbi:MAG: [Fe-Fe] hydrogenase large subunit C-terminal domain-containing protein, partial [Candidatus Adiutrix sp.]
MFRGREMGHLQAVIQTVLGKCINCHRCISVCPVKFANDASGEAVLVNHNRCIGCGRCLHACEHGARVGVDDFDNFFRDLQRGVNMVAIVAPAIAATFPQKYLNLNGWLKSMGIKGVFDVSFGAELTVKSYVEHIKNNKPSCVIAQPCPAIVTYCQIYSPELLPYLAPADSPMLHTIRMIKRFFPDVRGKIAVISPCYAKSREFRETGLGDYNVTFNALDKYFTENGVNLADFPALEYDNPSPERAVLFSSPGGLMATAERMAPGISEKVRKIEGPEVVYHYLATLPKMIQEGKAPLLIDCLNCEAGCNGGTAVPVNKNPIDELETHVADRAKEMKRAYVQTNRKWWRREKSVGKAASKLLDKSIN